MYIYKKALTYQSQNGQGTFSVCFCSFVMIELNLHEKDGYMRWAFSYRYLRSRKTFTTYEENLSNCRKIEGYLNGQIEQR